MQVDFGETFIHTESGQRKKIYVAAFILAHSRYRYAEFSYSRFDQDTGECISLFWRNDRGNCVFIGHQ